MEVRTAPFSEIAALNGWRKGYARKLYSILGIPSIQQIKRQVLLKDRGRSEAGEIAQYIHIQYGAQVSPRAVEMCKMRLCKVVELSTLQLKLFDVPVTGKPKMHVVKKDPPVKCLCVQLSLFDELPYLNAA